MLTRLLVAAAFLLTASNLFAQVPPSLVGTWVAVHDPHGVVYPHLEELRIARDGGVVTAVYGLRMLPKCEDSASALSGPCAVGRANAKGRLVVDNVGQTIALASLALQANAMAGIGLPSDELVARDLFWFGPGKPWKFRREENSLVMSRESRPLVPKTELDGTRLIAVDKRYFPVDDDFAGNAIALVEAGAFSLSKLLCIIPFATNSAERNGAFRALVRDIAIVQRRQQEMRAQALAKPSAEAISKFNKILETLSPSGKPPSGADVAAAAAALRVDAAQVTQFTREISLRPRSKPVDELLFTVLKPHEKQIRACHDQNFK
jgi:hypothetical protein